MELHTGLSPCLAIEASFQTTCQILLHSSPAMRACGVSRTLPQQWTLCIQETDSAICESRPQSEEKSCTVRKERNACDSGPAARERGKELPLSHGRIRPARAQSPSLELHPLGMAPCGFQISTPIRSIHSPLLRPTWFSALPLPTDMLKFGRSLPTPSGCTRRVR